MGFTLNVDISGIHACVIENQRNGSKCGFLIQMLKNKRQHIHLNKLLAFHLNWNFRVVQNEKLKKQYERSKQQTGNGWQKQEINTNNRRQKTECRNQTNIQTNKHTNKHTKRNERIKQTNKQTNKETNKPTHT